MSASMLSSASVATTRNTTVAQATTVAPFSGLKSLAAFPVTRKTVDITTLANNGGRVRCMKVWPPEGMKKFETLSYLPPLTDEQLLKEVDYLLRKGWVPCLEFQTQNPYPHREHFHGGGYYDGRYWTMWKLPMFGCTDATQVLKELQEAKKEYPHAYIRILGFDAKRQVQCIMFIAHQPK